MDILARDAVIVELASETKNDVLAELAHAARFFRYPEFRENLSAAKNREDVFQAFEDEDSKFDMRCSYSSIEATRGES